MAATGTPTPNLGLRIPVGTDPASVDDINYNSNLLDTALGAVGNTSVKDQLDELSDQIASYHTWTKIAEETTTANQNFDKTVSVTYPSGLSEIMFTLQRVSNGRTFATSVCPIIQFLGGAIYAFGMYVLTSEIVANMVNIKAINAVAIHGANNTIELAMNANDEAIKMRVFVR